MCSFLHGVSCSSESLYLFYFWQIQNKINFNSSACFSDSLLPGKQTSARVDSIKKKLYLYVRFPGHFTQNVWVPLTRTATIITIQIWKKKKLKIWVIVPKDTNKCIKKPLQLYECI